MKNKFIRAILISVLGTLAVIYFIQPIISWLIKIFLSVGSFVYQSYIDTLYMEIAKGSHFYSILSAQLIIVLLLVFFLIMIASNFIYYSFNRDLGSDSEAYKNTSFFSILMRMKPSFVLTGAQIMIVFGLLTFLIQGMITTSTIAYFDQHMKIITPYITSNEKDLIISDFASMKTQQDYIEVYEKIYFIADKNNLKLSK